MASMKKILLNITILVLFYSALVYGASSTDFKKALQASVNQWRVENGIPGMAVTVYQPIIGTMTVTSGAKTMTGWQPITPTTLFQIGSITKTFTAAVILNLEAQGKLSINDKIGPWFPQYPNWQAITIKQLLNMSSGIFQYEKDPAFAKANQHNPQKQWRVDQLLAVSYQHPLYFQPGTSWHYCNANYILLGEIVEKITHQKLATIFDRLLQQEDIKLPNTYYIPNNYNNSIMQQMAHGYQDKQDITADNMSTFGAAGAMISTSSDIAQWIKALFSGKILAPQQLAEFMTTIPFDVPPKPKGSRYGLGLYYLNTIQYGDIWWYSGVTDGYISLFMYVPNRQLIITANINRIQQKNYWLLMPDHPFAQIILALAVDQIK